jgi:hypothetical protein
MHFHFLKTFTIDLAQLQEVPCEGPALSRRAVASPLPSDPQAKAHPLSFWAKIAVVSCYPMQVPLCKLAHS